MQRLDKIDVYAQVNGEFKKRERDPEEFLRNPGLGVQVVFARWNLFQQSKSLRELLSSDFAYPIYLWEDVHHDSNGYAGNASYKRSTGEEVHTSWFHFLIKQLEELSTSGFFPNYQWYEMSFYVHSTKSPSGAREGAREGALLFCFDTPPQFGTGLIELFNTTRSDPPREPLAFLQSTVVEVVVGMYDSSVWHARHHIRKIEKERPKDLLHSNFEQLHEMARHVIHICEVLEVSVDSVHELLNGPGTVTTMTCGCSGTVDGARPNCAHSEMRFWLRMLRNFVRRAESLKLRLSNEINLGYNVVVQRDSKATVEISTETMNISRAAQSDSASMKTISVVTLAFLPATFVSTVFSMSFFALNVDEQGETKWNMSKQFWIYWVIAIPLTIMTIAVWTYHQRADLKWLRPFLNWKSSSSKQMV